MSKSGLFAHFGSKEELQLATIETARVVFDEQVIEPALEAPDGVERLRSYVDHYFLHISSGIYPGGCFFASLLTEMDTHAGPIRDRAVEVMDGWIALLADAARDAQAEGLIDRVGGSCADRLRGRGEPVPREPPVRGRPELDPARTRPPRDRAAPRRGGAGCHQALR